MDLDDRPRPTVPPSATTGRLRRHRRAAPSDVAWIDHAARGWGIPVGSLTTDSMRQLYPGMVSRQEGELSEFGRRLGRAGQAFVPTSDVVADLHRPADRDASLAERPGVDRPCAEAVAEGWADGLLGWQPPEAGPRSTPALLRHRVHLLYAECAEAGLRAPAQHTLGVLELVVPPDDDERRGAALRRGLRSLRREFRHGEALAASPRGRLLLLARRTTDLPTRLERAAHAWEASLVDDPEASVRTWLEPLPLDGMLADPLLEHLLTD